MPTIANKKQTIRDKTIMKKLFRRTDFSIFSAEYNREFIQVLTEQKVNLSTWLKNVAFDANIMHKNTGYTLSRDIRDFFCRNVETLNIQGLGLAMGKRTNITSHGTLGYAVLSSPSYEDGFRVFQNYLKLRINFLQLDLNFTEDTLQFSFTLTEETTPYISRFYYEAAIAGTRAFISQFLKEKPFTASYEFNYPDPGYPSLYQKHLGSEVTFNCLSCSLKINRSYFIGRTGFENPSIYAISKQQCETELAQYEKAQCIVSKINSVLYGSPLLLPPQDQIADQLSMSIRTLRRKLNDAGTTYQEILDSVKESLAKKYLCESQWTIREIANMLGYSEPNNFKRAFKRWTTHSPYEYRKHCLEKASTTHIETSSAKQSETE